jgi:anti-sigma factor RsiW
MNSMINTEGMLAAYVDGELDADDVSRVEHLIATRPDYRRIVAVQREATSLLRAACAETFYANGAVPLMRPRPLRQVNRVVHWAAAAAVAGMIGFGGGAVWMNAPKNARDHLLTEVADYHRVYSRETQHLVEVRADQTVELTDWLGGRLGRKLVVPDLRPSGLRFAGGRMLVIDGKPVAELMYTREQGAPVALCIMQIDGTQATQQTPVRVDRRGELALASWQAGAHTFVVVGDMGDDAIRVVADSAMSQIAG